MYKNQTFFMSINYNCLKKMLFSLIKNSDLKNIFCSTSQFF